jgi:hypothetical protein
MFESRVLRRIFGSVREEVMRGWRRLHNEELHNLCSSSHIVRVIKSRRMNLGGHVARMGDINAYIISVGKPERKKPSPKWEMPCDRDKCPVLNYTLMNLLFPQNA